MANSIHTWFVLSNENGLVLAVYGSALECIASHKGREIRASTGCAVAMHRIAGPRPRVYDLISMQGQIEWV